MVVFYQKGSRSMCFFALAILGTKYIRESAVFMRTGLIRSRLCIREIRYSTWSCCQRNPKRSLLQRPSISSFCPSSSSPACCNPFCIESMDAGISNDFTHLVNQPLWVMNDEGLSETLWIRNTSRYRTGENNLSASSTSTKEVIPSTRARCLNALKGSPRLLFC